MWAPCGGIRSPPMTSDCAVPEEWTVRLDPSCEDGKMQCFIIFWCTFSAPSQSSLRSNYTLWGKNTLQQQLHIQKTEKKISCRSEQTFSISQEFPNCSLRWGNYISADKSTQISPNIIRPERRWDLSLEEAQESHSILIMFYYSIRNMKWRSINKN